MNKQIIKCRSIICGKVNQAILRYGMKRENRSHIAMFHKIVLSDSVLGDEDACSYADFIDYIDYCEKIGMQFISIDQLLSLSVEEALRNKVVITFDDGYKDFFDNAANYLAKRKIPFTCFITTSFLNKKGYIGFNELTELSKIQECTIGMHSHEHLMWRFESDEAFVKDYLKCKETLEMLTGIKQVYYAFPYGSEYAVSKKNISTLKHLNCKAIFTTKQLKLSKTNLKAPSSGLPRLDIAGYYAGRYKQENKGLNIGK